MRKWTTVAVGTALMIGWSAGAALGQCPMGSAPGAQNGMPWCDDFESYLPGVLCEFPNTSATPDCPFNGWQSWSHPDTLGGEELAHVVLEGGSNPADDWTPASPDGTGRMVRIGGANNAANYTDMVRVFTNYTVMEHDFYRLIAHVFVPSSGTGDMYFIGNPGFDGGGAGTTWSIQLVMNVGSGVIHNDLGSNAELPLLTDQWARLRFDIDLVSDTCLVFYGPATAPPLAEAFLDAYSWTGESGGGMDDLRLQAIDLFTPESSDFFYDDISLVGMAIPVVFPPAVRCLNVQYLPNNCAEFALSVRNANVNDSIDTFYLDIQAGTGGAICNTLANVTPPAGYTPTLCGGWTAGHALLRFVGPNIAPGGTVNLRLVVDTNGPSPTPYAGGTVPAYSVLVSGAQGGVNQPMEACNFGFGPGVAGDWGAPPSSCTAFLPVPSLSGWSKAVLAAIVLAGGLLVLRSRRPMTA